MCSAAATLHAAAAVYTIFEFSAYPKNRSFDTRCPHTGALRATQDAVFRYSGLFGSLNQILVRGFPSKDAVFRYSGLFG